MVRVKNRDRVRVRVKVRVRVSSTIRNGGPSNWRTGIGGRGQPAITKVCHRKGPRVRDKVSVRVRNFAMVDFLMANRNPESL